MPIRSHRPGPALVEHVRSRLTAITAAGCWEWTGAKALQGYGVIRVQVGGKSKLLRVPRIMCEAVHGPCPEGKDRVLHSCDNPPCANPDHLRWGTAQENIQDAIQRGRLASKLDPDRVRSIRQDPRNHQLIAADYGVSDALIDQVKSGKAWGHVQ